MNRKSKVIVSIVGITIVALALLGLTYAYYLTRIEGNTNANSISITTANLQLLYNDGDGSIIGSGKTLVPDNDNPVGTKVFTVTNNGNETVEDYAVILENFAVKYHSGSNVGEVTNLVNGEDGEPDMKLVITCKSYKNYTTTKTETGTCNGMNGFLPEKSDILVINTIDKEITHEYTATLTYLEDGTNQSDDMNKTITGRFNIIDTKNTVDISGKVDNYNSNDIVTLHSEPKESVIYTDGTYKFMGVKPDIHTIKVENETSQIEISKLSIVKGNVSNVGTTSINNETINQITITDDMRDIDINIDKTNGTITVGEQLYVFNNPYSEGTLAYNIINSANIAANTVNSDRTTANGLTKYGDVSNVEIIPGRTEYEYRIIESDSSTYPFYYFQFYCYDGVEYNEKTGEMSLIGENNCEISESVGKYLFDPTGREKVPEDQNITEYYIIEDYDIFYVEGPYGETIWDTNEITSKKFTVEKEISNIIHDEIKGKSSLRKTEDDDGTTYYYRGVAKDNYVNFAGMCWKIVRINGDGSTKIILEDQNTTCESLTYTGDWLGPYSSWYYPTEWEGGNSSKYYIIGPLNFSEFDRNLTTKISNVYSKNINDYLIKDNWCWESKETTSLNKYNSLKCYGDKQYGYAATITKSELDYLGGVDTSYLYSEFEQKYIKEQNEIHYVDYEPGFTLLTSQLGHDYMKSTRDEFNPDYFAPIAYSRPAINLKAGIEITGGNGTYKNPYVIK